jgi:hypothetical protein
MPIDLSALGRPPHTHTLTHTHTHAHTHTHTHTHAHTHTHTHTVALEGALGRPAPKDLRRPRQLVKIDKSDEASGDSKAAGNGESPDKPAGGGAGDGKTEGVNGGILPAAAEVDEAEARGGFVCACLCVCDCMYVCMHACMHACMCVCV